MNQKNIFINIRNDFNVSNDGTWTISGCKINGRNLIDLFTYINNKPFQDSYRKFIRFFNIEFTTNDYLYLNCPSDLIKQNRIILDNESITKVLDFYSR